jgi:hypothetical protein
MFSKKSDTAVIKTIENIEGIGGMTVNERLWVSGLMDEFESALLHDEKRARQILQWLKVDEPSINIMIPNRTELIAELGIDTSERLYIVPTTQEFNMIRRRAFEVYWDSVKNRLYTPRRREWTYYKCYCNMIYLISIEYSVKLHVTEETVFTNIPQSLKDQLEGKDQ